MHTRIIAKYIAVGAGPIYVPVTVCAAGVRIGVGCRCGGMECEASGGAWWSGGISPGVCGAPAWVQHALVGSTVLVGSTLVC